MCPLPPTPTPAFALQLGFVVGAGATKVRDRPIRADHWRTVRRRVGVHVAPVLDAPIRVSTSLVECRDRGAHLCTLHVAGSRAHHHLRSRLGVTEVSSQVFVTPGIRRDLAPLPRVQHDAAPVQQFAAATDGNESRKWGLWASSIGT